MQSRQMSSLLTPLYMDWSSGSWMSCPTLTLPTNVLRGSRAMFVN